MKDNFYNKMLAKTLEMLSDRIIAFIRLDKLKKDVLFRISHDTTENQKQIEQAERRHNHHQ